MSFSDELRYRAFLVRRASRKTFFGAMLGGGTGGSILLAAFDPSIALAGLVATGTAAFVSLESQVLAFPKAFRPVFRIWFSRYLRLRELVPPESAIDLRYTSVDPNFLLDKLCFLAAEGVRPESLRKFCKRVDTAFAKAEAELARARDRRDEMTYQQAAESIAEEGERL